MNMQNTTLRTARAVAIACAATSMPAVADDVYCPRNLGNVTVDGNVLISGACRMEGTHVKGNIHIYTGGSLIARDIRIEGSVQTERANFVDIRTSQINGSIQLDDMVGDTSIVSGSGIGAAIQLNNNLGRLEILGNEVNADIQAFSNRGGVIIEQNVVDGNLQCKSNQPAPSGGGNRVGGNKEDQCANLVPEGSQAAIGVATLSVPASGTSIASSSVADNSESGGGGSFGLATLLTFLSLFISKSIARVLGLHR